MKPHWGVPPVSHKELVAFRLVIVQQKGGVLAMELALLGLRALHMGR